MAVLRVNPTRMELKKIQTRYITARRGHKLLKDKRDELMKKFLEVVREDKALREKVEASLASVQASFSVASAVSSPLMLKEALILPKREGRLDVTYKNVMSVVVPEFSLELSGSGSDSYNYGMAFTSGELDASLVELNDLLEDMVRLAEMEKTAQMLAEEIEKTRRRVNALEYIMIPQYLETMKSIKMKLDENERGNTTRLMKVKDMMLQAQMQGSPDNEDDFSEA
ncbi:MAG: V-type ATP synthase subunit D [Clostridia bacterium]|nr:V-type ATP synthase subunit D [Clostridia bacterium]